MEHIVQFPGATAARIVDFFCDAPVPAPLTSPLTAVDCADFMREDRIACFTLSVPLEIIANGGLKEYVHERAFGFPVELDSLEYQAVGATFNDSFDKEFTGSVHLRMTCAIHHAEVEA